MKALRSSVIAATLALVATTGTAADYPSRPIRLLVPLAAGSTADILSRILGAELSKDLGQQVIVDDRPGAGGTIATADLARASADGYTIEFASQGTLIFNVALYSKPGYDPLKDFSPIILIGGVSNVMVVAHDSPANSPADVIAMARAKPGVLTFSSGGNGTSHHLSGVLFGQLTDTQLQHIPYKGAPQGIVAVMTGEVNMGFYNTPTVIAQIKEGKLKALAVTGRQRSPLLPKLPTLDESGVKGYEVDTWFGFIAPAGTPAEIIKRLRGSLAKAVADPAVREKLVAQGFELAPDAPPEAFKKLIKDDLVKWLPIVKASGARLD